MARLEIKLLGEPQLIYDGVRLSTTKNQKGWALLFYLVQKKPRRVEGKELADMLWMPPFGNGLSESEINTKKKLAQANLRGAWNRLGDIRENHLKTEKIGDDTYRSFDTDSDYVLDIEQFDTLLRNNPRPRHIKEAIALYRGDFLDGFALPQQELFEEWRQEVQLALKTQLINALQAQAEWAERQGHFGDAIDALNQLLAHDNEMEAVHRRLMRSYALNGQQGEALQQYNRCLQMVRELWGREPDRQTMTLRQEIEQGAVRPLPPIPFFAPPLPRHFVGRSALVTTLTQKMFVRSHAIYVLAGMGGVGKTTLATHIAHAAVDDYPDGVFWASLVHATPMDIIATWAEAFGKRFGGAGDIATRSAAWRNLLHDKNVLIILDNVETADQVRPLLPPNAHSTVVITTRNHAIAAAFTHLETELFALDVLDTPHALDLLRGILGDGVIAAEQEAAVTICDLLENLPLALEITAQRLRVYKNITLADQVERLRAARLDYLTLGDRAVRLAFEESWHILTPDQRHTFKLLGLFEQLEIDADAIAALTDQPRFRAVDQLERFVSLSLLHPAGKNYRQHALLTQFAHEKLTADPELYARMQVRFATHYATVAATAVDYHALRPFWTHFQRGIAFAHAQAQWQHVYDFVMQLTDAWVAQARLTEGRVAYALALDAAEQLADPAAIANIALKWGRACLEQSDNATAQALLERALQLYRDIDDPAGLSDALVWYGYHCANNLHDYEGAHEHWIECQAIKKQIDDRNGYWLAQCYLASVHRMVGHDVRTAERLLRAILDADQASSLKPSLVIDTLRDLALICMERGDAQEADQLCAQAIVLCEATQNSDSHGAIILTQLMLCRTQGNSVDGLRYGKQCQQWFEEIGAPRYVALALNEMAELYRSAEHDYAQAKKLLNEAIEIQERIGERTNLIISHYILALVYHDEGAYHPAIAQLKETIAAARPLTHLFLPSMLQTLEKWEHEETGRA